MKVGGEQLIGNDVRDERETTTGFLLLGMSLGGIGSQDQKK